MYSRRIMDILEKIMFGCTLNILWMFGVCIGLFIFGVGPATVAVTKTLQKKELFESQSSLKPIMHIFFKSYKKVFLKANITFCVFMFYSILLILNYFIILNNQLMYSVFVVPIIFMLVYGVACIITSISVSVYTNGTFMEKAKVSLLSPLVIPSVTIFNILYLGIFLLLSYTAPVGLFLIYVPLFIKGIMTINFKKMEEKKIFI